MKIPGVKIPDAALQIPARMLDALQARRQGTVVAVGMTGLVVVLFLLMSLFGGDPSEDASTVIRIGGAMDDHSGGRAGGAPVSLIAANGAVISDPALIEMTPDGPLPKISEDGRLPMAVYSRRIDKSDPRPKIALTVGGLGLSASLTQAAVDMLPPGITLAFTPYGSSLQGMVSAARASGHEVLMEVPLEPYDYPNNDPGQNTLLAESASKDNLARLQWVLSRFTGYAGLVNSQGSKYLASLRDTEVLFGAVQARGLYFMDNGQSDQSVARDAARTNGAAFTRADMQIDLVPSKDAIDGQLAELEKQAQQKGVAIAVATAYPVTLERLKAWAATLEQKGLVLVPTSALTTVEKIAPHPIPAPAHPLRPARPAGEAPANPEGHSDPGPHP
jgi:polysaccharide deacetylase 2 family uncharacterized protein YibQ